MIWLPLSEAWRSKICRVSKLYECSKTHLLGRGLVLDDLPVVHVLVSDHAEGGVVDPDPERHVLVHHVRAKLGLGREVEHLELAAGCDVSLFVAHF